MAEGDELAVAERYPEALDRYQRAHEIRRQMAEELTPKVTDLGQQTLHKGSHEQITAVLTPATFFLTRQGRPLSSLRKAALDAMSRRPDEDVQARLAAADYVLYLGRFDSGVARLEGSRLAAFNRQYRALLAKGIKLNPDNAHYAIAPATLLDAEDDCADCAALLEPHRDALGDTEGARILAQADIRRGDFQAAFPLLEANVDTALKHMSRVSDEYDVW